MAIVAGRGGYSPGHSASSSYSSSTYSSSYGASKGYGMTDRQTRAYAQKQLDTHGAGSKQYKAATTFTEGSTGATKAKGSFQAMGKTASDLGFTQFDAYGVNYGGPIGPGFSKTGKVLFDAPIGGGSAFTGIAGSITDFLSIFGIEGLRGTSTSSGTDRGVFGGILGGAAPSNRGGGISPPQQEAESGGINLMLVAAIVGGGYYLLK